jgi:hypothetical protein
MSILSAFPTRPSRLQRIFRGAHIWVPALTPVMWGWSIRVGRRTDGEWGILRRKLLMPTSLDAGPELPLWQTDTYQIAYSADLIA